MKSILNYKDTGDMFVINSSRFKKLFGVEFFSGQYDHVDFGLIPSGDFQNLRIEIDYYDFKVAGNHPLVFYNGAIATSGLLIQISAAGLFNVFIYNGTGVNILTATSLAGWNRAAVNYTENGVGILLNGNYYTATYQTLVYGGTNRKTQLGRIYNFNNSSYDTKAIVSKCNIYRLDSNANILSTILECDFVGSGTTVPDLSGNGNDGTFVNNPQWVQL
jgi:hypothetical protein